MLIYYTHFDITEKKMLNTENVLTGTESYALLYIVFIQLYRLCFVAILCGNVYVIRLYMVTLHGE